MKKLMKEIVKWRKSKGFITPHFHGDKGLLLGKLMKVVTEVSEAAEAICKGNFPNFKEEMADTFIRLFDICGTSGIDIEEEINKKMKINWTRPRLHGNVTGI